MKSAQIRSYFWSVFSCIRTEYRDLHIQSEYRKIRTRNNSVFGHFSRSERLPKHIVTARAANFRIKLFQLFNNQRGKEFLKYSVLQEKKLNTFGCLRDCLIGVSWLKGLCKVITVPIPTTRHPSLSLKIFES